MSEFVVDGHTYQVGKLNALQQFHVARRIAPIIPHLMPAYLKLRVVLAEREKDEDKKAPLRESDILQFVELLQPLADALAAMKDEDAEKIFVTCLSVVQRRVGSEWISVYNVPAKQCVYSDLNDLSKQLPMIVQVLKATLGPFINGLHISPAASVAAAG